MYLEQNDIRFFAIYPQIYFIFSYVICVFVVTRACVCVHVRPCLCVFVYGCLWLCLNTSLNSSRWKRWAFVCLMRHRKLPKSKRLLFAFISLLYSEIGKNFTQRGDAYWRSKAEWIQISFLLYACHMSQKISLYNPVFLIFRFNVSSCLLVIHSTE